MKRVHVIGALMPGCRIQLGTPMQKRIGNALEVACVIAIRPRTDEIKLCQIIASKNYATRRPSEVCSEVCRHAGMHMHGAPQSLPLHAVCPHESYVLPAASLCVCRFAFATMIMKVRVCASLCECL